MKHFLGAIMLILLSNQAFTQNNAWLQNYASEVNYDQSNRVNFIKISDNQVIKESSIEGTINRFLSSDGSIKVLLTKSETDEIGFTHQRYSLVNNGIPLFNKMIIAHLKSGKLISLNGDLYTSIINTTAFSISENEALNRALNKIKAKKYKWENKEEEAHMKEVLNQPQFSYYPSAQKVYFEIKGVFKSAFQFNIYAEVPLYRANVFVDANTGAVLAEQNLICNVNATGIASTKYSGTQTITCDQNGTSYRLRETARGLGVDTYNMNHTTTYSATDFTNASTSWTSTGADQAATDAQWGAESTYDYYMTRFSRNSINNMGYKLLSYVHYSNNYNNAFWDGTRMTYGDGNGSTFTILTALDVCGHEITHGLVSNTSNLNGGGTGEADALNEGFADIFGTSVERFARPLNFNWKMGSDITPGGNGIRNMQNPKLLSDPDTYLGQYWDPAGEPHNNAGPAIKWFYLLVAGGSGTNDVSNTYNVTGLGNIDAEKIAYRALTYYFTSGTTYLIARAAAIQAAKDLFGPCANQVVQTANAWYAVGVGPQFVANQIAPNFITANTSYCTLPASLIFTNTTASGLTYVWDFGDGSAVSTATNAFHTYTANGAYTVKLKATGCNNTLDSAVKNSFVVINVPSYPSVASISICNNTSGVLNASANATIKWYATSTPTGALYVGNTFTTPPLNLSTFYYVANTVTNTAVLGGRLTNTNGSFLANANQWLIFDVTQNSTLNSVVMYAQTAGNRYIELRNSSSTTINSAVINLSVGANTVLLNFPLTPGTNYQLGLTNGSTCDLYRSNASNTYPYNIGNCVNITNSSSGTSFYYWYYNWSVTKEDCLSPLVPVMVNVLSTIPSTINVANNIVCKDDAVIFPTANPTGGNFSGIGVSNGGFNPSIGTGVYNILYSTTDANGCLTADSLEMQVLDCVGINEVNRINNLKVYPNPTTDVLNISQEGNEAKSFNICDMQGRFILSEKILNPNHQIHLEKLAKGIYLLSLQNASQKTIYITKLVVD